MTFATWSIRNPIPSILLFILLMLGGIWGFRNLAIQDLPDLDLPRVNVVIEQPGASPAQLETEVARKVEDSIATLSGLRHTETSITDGRVSIQVEFALEKGRSDALIETKDAVDRIRSDLPTDIEQPTVSAVTRTGDPILVFAIASTRLSEEELSWFIDDTVTKSVLAVSGVGEAERIGGVQREIRVDIDPVQLHAMGITAGDVSRSLRQVQQQSSGGRALLGTGEQSLRTIATVRQAADLRQLPLVLADGSSVKLEQVATVSDTIADRTEAAMLGNKSVLGLRIYRAKGFDEVRVAQDVREALARLTAAEPSLRLSEVSGSVDYTMEQYKGSMDMLYEGAILAIFVVWLFLRDWRATLIAATALPLSVIPTFGAMAWLGFSLNTLTLLALSVVVGILVDDAIVEIENIERHSHMGKPMRQAAGDAVTEIALAVTATTMSLVVIFLPTTMMSGVVGLLFRQFGWTAVIAVLASLAVARLLTPMMAAYLLKSRPRIDRGDSAMMTWYLALVAWCLNYRKITLLSVALIFVASIALVPLIPTALMPPADTGQTTVNFELPPGSALENARVVALAARQAVETIDGVASIFTTIGDAGTGEVRKGAMVVKLLPPDQRPSQVVVENALVEALIGVPGARFSLDGGRGKKLELVLAGDDAMALKASAQALEDELRSIAGIGNISSTASLERPEITLRPNAQAAAELGVTAAAIGEALRIATSGDFDANVARLNLDNRQIYIRTRLTDHARQDLDTLANLRVRGADGLVPLSSVADLSIESGPSQIDRYDRRRYVTISADLGGMPLGDALAAVMASPAVKAMPSTVNLIEVGDAELQDELLSGFAMALIVGILCVYCVIVLLFRDFLQPFTILSAIPLAAGGAFAALLIAGSELDVPSMIGLVMLTGIVTKNSILLVEYAILGMQERKMSLQDALMDACHKRARPIIMTTVAMIAGMLPIALGFGADASFRQPMAIAVIGGLLSSTGLSLLVVPVVFSYVSGFEGLLKRLTAYRPSGAQAISS
nr:efflux RND transporter permease subunit [uncultured Dongia sp.]